MENIGDWLYVIVLIVVGISSMLSSASKKAKQKAEKAAQPQKVPTGDVFDDEFWGNEGTGNTQPAQINQPQMNTNQPYRHEVKQKTSYFTGQREGISTIPNKNMEQTIMDIENESTPITLEDLPRNTEDWRKAFVYNEILNRKY